MLVDHEIRQLVDGGWDLISPFDESSLQPASYDMHLSPWFRSYEGRHAIDLRSPERRTQVIEAEEGSLRIGPGEFLLATTAEVLRMPSFLAGRVEGKSSLARVGLVVHVTAGFIDPGFQGHVTLELYNTNRVPIILYVGMPVCQMSFQHCSHPSSSYKGKYQGAFEPIPQESQFYKNFEEHQ